MLTTYLYQHQQSTGVLLSSIEKHVRKRKGIQSSHIVLFTTILNQSEGKRSLPLSHPLTTRALIDIRHRCFHSPRVLHTVDQQMAECTELTKMPGMTHLNIIDIIRLQKLIYALSSVFTDLDQHGCLIR